jgi:outer membrane receptor protein involved in Fe transport
MSTRSFKGSLLASTFIAGIAVAAPSFGQGMSPAPLAPTDSQEAIPPAAPSDQTPPVANQTSSPAAPAGPAAPAPTAGNEIVITGTLIRNPNLVASAPVTVVGHDEMQLRQTNTAEEVLRTIPGAAPSIGAQVNNGNTGSSFVNLRSLGSNRNIVLLDGVRLVPADLLGRVDLNNIPLALIDRVDVLTGGASSTYGADAVAGVINFITRSDFAGMELAVSDQITQRGDGNIVRGDLTIGANFDDGRGNAVMSLGYIESDPVYQGGDRPWSNLALDSTNPGSLAGAGSSTTTPSAFDFNNIVTRQQVGPGGNTIVNFYQPFNFNPYNVFQVPFQRYNLFTQAHYDITNHLTVYGRGLFSYNVVNSIIAPSGVFGNTVTVPLSNPFLSAQQRSVLCTDLGLTAAQCTAAATATSPSDPNYRTDTFGLRRRTPEVGPRITNIPTHIFDFRAGVRGDITDKIGFDVFASRGISERSTNAIHFVSLSRVRQALLATNPTTCLTNTNGCVPLNIFGASGTITPEMASFVELPSTFVTHVELSQARATINGDTPLQLWAKNPVSFAIGGEYRKYHAEQKPDALSRTPGELGGAGGATSPIDGGLDVYEGFAEVIAPIVSDTPFAEELQLEAGIRQSHYTVATPSSPKFNTTTWKLAASWAPVRDIKFRGAYNHAVRAPNIAELFAPPVTGLTNLAVDPCAGAAPLSNANLTAICLAQGAPAGRIGLINNPTAGQANITASGNLHLKPEVANTWTIGAIARPRFLPGFSATIDYYHIKVTDAITAPTPGDLINACFGNITAASASDPACTIIRRSTITGQLDGSPAEVPGLFAALSNQGTLTTDGVDLTFDYRRTLGTVMGSPAKLNLNFGGNYTHSQKFQATPSSVNRECVGYYSANCGFPAGGLLPKYTFNQRTTLSLGRVDLSLLWRHLSSMKYEPGLPPLFSGTIVSTPSSSVFFNDPGNHNGETVDFNHIGAFNYFDFTTRFNVNEHLTLTFTVANLFDKKPPFVGNTAGTTSQNSGDTFPSTYDPLGRRFAASARIKF